MDGVIWQGSHKMDGECVFFLVLDIECKRVRCILLDVE